MRVVVFGIEEESVASIVKFNVVSPPTGPTIPQTVPVDGSGVRLMARTPEARLEPPALILLFC